MSNNSQKTHKPQIQDAQRTSKRTNTKKSTPRHILFKLQKNKDKDLE